MQALALTMVSCSNPRPTEAFLGRYWDDTDRVQALITQPSVTTLDSLSEDGPEVL